MEFELMCFMCFCVIVTDMFHALLSLLSVYLCVFSLQNVRVVFHAHISSPQISLEIQMHTLARETG